MKPYKARSLKGAEQQVRLLRKQLATCHEMLDRWHRERIALAKLAAKGPAFFNPLEVMAAEQVRDNLLNGLGMNPDGTFKNRARSHA